MISVIITTYNRKDRILDSIRSILNQTYKDLEVVVVDDGSTDRTQEFIESKIKDRRLRYLKLPENKGATFARNTGLGEIKGEYFLVWDSDDILYQNALETVKNIFDHNPELVTVSAPARSLLKGKEVPYKKIPEGIVPKETIICRLLPSNHKIRVSKTSSCRGIMYKSKNIDFLVNVEIAERGLWYCYPDYLGDVILESGKDSLTISRKKTNLRLAIERSVYLASYLDKYKVLLISMAPGKYAGFSYGAAIGLLADRKKKIARFHIKEAVRNDFRIKYLAFYFLTLLPFSKDILKLFVWFKNHLFI